MIHVLPYISTLVVFVFAFLVLQRYRQRGGLHLLLWGIGFVMYGLGTFAEAYLAVGYSPIILHGWYLFGAVLTPAWLGQGTIHLLVRRRNVANILLIVLTLASLFTALHVFGLPTQDALYDVAKPVSAQYKNIMERTSLTTTLLAVFAAYGTLALVGGALYSAYIFWRKRIMPQRVLGNVLIAAGALSPALGGVLVARGMGDYLFISELLGAIIMFVGFRFATTQQSVSAPNGAQPARA
ncbi:MAG TPA: hypothetical protein VFF59_10100 [Anaerolineae bacterium]|nr:hypothetical protein [Anaerolineae bacterium]